MADLLNRAIADGQAALPNDPLFKRIVQVTCIRETVPADPTQFNVSVIPGTTTITDLRVQFKIQKSLTKTPNTCDVTITNLAATTRANLETKPLNVSIAAGYNDTAKLLFAGDLRFAMTKIDGPNWETLLQLGEDDCHHRYSLVNKSYGPGTTYLKVIQDAAKSFGLDLPQNVLNDPALQKQFAHGTISDGPTRDELTRLLAPFGYRWSTQGGTLRALRDNEVQSTSPIPIDELHGMIGTPEFSSPPRSGKAPHMTVKMLLYPELVPGDLVQVTSKVKNGLFKVLKVKHEGDTHGHAWDTDIEISPFDVNASDNSTNPVANVQGLAQVGASRDAQELAQEQALGLSD